MGRARDACFASSSPPVRIAVLIDWLPAFRGFSSVDILPANLGTRGLLLREEQGLRNPAGWLIQRLDLGEGRHSPGIVQDGPLRAVGEFVVGLAVQHAAGLALPDPAPLLEEEGHPGALALIADRDHPLSG